MINPDLKAFLFEYSKDESRNTYKTEDTIS